VTSTSTSPESSSDSAATISVHYCGNGVVDDGEECDDGNELEGDACSLECTNTFEIAWTEAVSANDRDVWLQRYESDGSEGWSLRWGGPDALFDSVRELAWSDGSLFVAGVSVSVATGEDILVMAVDATRQSVLWSHGNPLPAETIELDGFPLLVDFVPSEGGGVLAAGIDPAGVVATRLDDAWLPTWSTYVAGTMMNDFPFGLDQHADSAALVALRLVDEQLDAIASGFHPDGTAWWADVYDAAGHANNGWYGVAIDGQGDVVVVGYTQVGDGAYDAVVRRYHPL
jgi:cysteine-rich repeat protein